MGPDLLLALKCLTGVDRLRILGRLADRSRTSTELADELGLTLPRVEHEVGLLRRAGLLEFDRRLTSPAHALVPGRLAELGRALDDLERAGVRTPVADVNARAAGRSPDEARVLRAFFDGGRLTSIPAHAAKRLVVLRHLRATIFAEDREYPEKEVNQRLALVHADVAALRRYLVDSGLMSRSAGIYRPASEAAVPGGGGVSRATSPG